MGPGIAVAATGVGAGDMISATNAGAKFGTVLLWTIVYGALLKFALTEGIGRWQLATGSTLLEGWVERLGRPIQYFFLIYLIIWSFLVGGGLLSAAGLAGHTVYSDLSVAQWGVIHALIAGILVWAGHFNFFLKVMQGLIGLMFFCFLICAWSLRPDLSEIIYSIAIPILPSGSILAVLSVLGGVGGSLTVMCYGYWIREAGRNTIDWLPGIRIDLAGSYILTGFFGIAVMILGAHIKPEAIGIDIVLSMADRLETVLGTFGRWSLYLGFWAAVITSLLGVWQGIPYLFADFIALFKQVSKEKRETMIRTDSPYYRGFILFLTFPPMALLLFERPVFIVILYTIVGALFMPFLAGTLLYMNSRKRWVGNLRTGKILNVLLALALILFLYLSGQQILEFFK